MNERPMHDMEGEPSAPGALASERQVRCALDVAAAAWLLEVEDLEGARRVLEAALSTVPHDVRARQMLALVRFRMRDFVGASELYERLLSEFRGDLALSFNLALCHLKSGRHGAAAAGLRQILEARPDHARARAWLRVAETASRASVAPPRIDTGFAAADMEPPSRASVRPNRLDELPRVGLEPGAGVAKDATGVVSVRVDGETRWLARADALQGYAGDVAVQPRAPGDERFVSIAGDGTAMLRAKDELVVIELHDEETCVRASALVAHASNLASEAADPDRVGDLGEEILRFTGTGAIVLEARAELVALRVSLTHATTVRWDNVVGWTGHVIGAPSEATSADGRPLARFAGNGSLLLAMHDDGASAPLDPTQEWYGRYQVLRRLEGTKAEEVLLARSHGPGGFQRKVILKRHLVRCEGDSRFLQDLARDAHAYALLTHPGIVRLYDFLLLDGHPVLVLEHVNGVSLAAMEQALRDQRRALGDDAAMYIAHGVLAALAAAHGARDPDTGAPAPVVHHDVHPGNVMLGWNGEVKLASFSTENAAPDGVGGAAPGAGTDVYLASLLLYGMLTRAEMSATFATDLEVRAVDDLDALRPDLGPGIRAALRVALAHEEGARSVAAAELMHEVQATANLRVARGQLVEVLASLRDSAFPGMTRSSRPPSLGESGDTERFRSLLIPKAAAVPVVPPDATAAKVPGAAPPATPATPATNVIAPQSARPAARSSLPAVEYRPSDTPPPIQPPSWVPREVRGEHLGVAKARWRTTMAIGLSAVAVAAGVAAVAWTPRSVHTGAAAASEPREEAAREVAPPPRATPPIASGAPDDPATVITTSAPAATPTATASAPEEPAITHEGTVQVPARSAHHRVFLDGRVIGEGAGDYRVRCGAHALRIGSRGEDRKIDVPCGGTLAVE